jgi:hypothetical protein
MTLPVIHVLHVRPTLQAAGLHHGPSSWLLNADSKAGVDSLWSVAGFQSPSATNTEQREVALRKRLFNLGILFLLLF